MFGRCCLLTRPDNDFSKRFYPGSKWISRSSLTNMAEYLLSLVDARIVDDINVTQKPGVCTPSTIAIQNHRPPLKFIRAEGVISFLCARTH